MDIWAWYREALEELREGGQQRLAEILDTMPDLLREGDHKQFDALLPEALALTRAIDHPWLEVFVRHWGAQSRIVDRCDVTQGMDEIVRLLDFAHGERTLNCPQSVCVTQDFCIAYSVLDGPGYADERLAASTETLARIDATWPCFHCISAEYADALFDLDRFAEAETFLRKQLAAAAGEDNKDLMLILKRAAALSSLGRHTEALQILEAIDASGEQKSRRILHAQLKAGEYARLQRLEEALATHPRVADLEPSDFVRWMRNELVMCLALPERNDARLGRTLRDFCNTLRANGALYQQGEIAAGAARLAVQRGRPQLAALHLEQLAELLPKLRRPQGLARDHAELTALIAPPTAVAAADESQLLAELGDDAEKNYEILLPAHAANPASEALTLALCRALQETGFPDNARQLLEAFVHAQPESGDLFYELMRLLARSGAEQRLRELAESVPAPMRAGAHFYLGRVLVRREDWNGAAQAFERARQFESEPNRSTVSNLATVYRNLGRNEDSLALLDELATSETDFSDDWDRMYVATLLGQHDKVRDSARRLGFKFEGEGPIDDPFEYCEVKLRDGVGREIGFRAIRINPVVVRITAMQAPDQPCRYRDEMLIDPYVLNPRESEAPAEGDDYLPAFRGERLLRAGGYRIYDLDGIHPGEAEVDALGKALIAREIHMSQRSGDGYQLTPREGEPTVRGIYIFIAVPQSVSTAAVLEILESALGDWKVPITWRGVLRELGNETELARHEGIAQELKL